MKITNALRNKLRNAKSAQEVMLKCKKCETDYKMTVGEISWYYEVGNIIPTLCKKCREEKKKFYKMKETEEMIKKENA